MVIPWVGLPAGDLLKRVEPTVEAKYVEFTTLLDPQQMPGQRRPVLEWPYVEGLRTGRGDAPADASSRSACTARRCRTRTARRIRLVVPWKYGFKSIKSIVRIRLVEQAAARRLERVGSRASTGFTRT